MLWVIFTLQTPPTAEFAESLYRGYWEVLLEGSAGVHPSPESPLTLFDKPKLHG